MGNTGAHDAGANNGAAPHGNAGRAGSRPPDAECTERVLIEFQFSSSLLKQKGANEVRRCGSAGEFEHRFPLKCQSSCAGKMCPGGDCLEGFENSGIVAAGFFCEPGPHDGANDRAGKTIVSEPVILSLIGFSALNKIPGTCQELLALADGIDDAFHFCGIRRELAAAQNDIEGFRKTDEARKPGGPSPGGKDSQEDLWQGEFGDLGSAGDAVVAGERDLKPSAHAGAMHGGNGRDADVLKPVENALAQFEKVDQLVGACLLQSLDVRSGNENGFLGALQDEGAKFMMVLFFDPIEMV